MKARILMTCLLIGIFHLNSLAGKTDTLSCIGSENISNQHFVGISTDSNEIFKPKFRFYLGAFHAFTNITLNINSESLDRGTSFNVEKVFGESGEILPRAELLFNPGKRHEIGLVLLRFHRSRTASLERDIQFGDTTFYVNSSVTSDFTYGNVALTYRFSVFEKERLSAGVSFGARYAEVSAGLKANLNENSYSVERRVGVPVALVGLHGTYYLDNHFLLRSTLEYFRLGINDYRLRVIDFRLAAEYYFFKNFGLGAEYHFFSTKIKKVPSGELNGNVNFSFSAPSFFLAMRF